eukprot:scpid98794/ scgid25078/ 
MFVVFLYAVIRSQHEVMRRKAIESTLKSANSMARYYNRKKRVQVEDFRVGDAVAAAVPKLDRVPPVGRSGAFHPRHRVQDIFCCYCFRHSCDKVLWGKICRATRRR